eukprot:TRINITY_DN50312_c0_g1_i1.p2 TRINITY_DN50312_c0_g1~~TRINITY_DN50312_c0_g1_i1.p2  ORF type:complete len:487 (+),score=269.74 TRINITY_DN50312_c0_g1_i1:85-1461(+)
MSRETALQSNVLQGYIDSEARVERLRRQHRQRAVRSETDREDAILQAEIEFRQRQKQRLREEGIAGAIEQRKAEQLRQEKQVQMVREGAPEIRALEQKLQAAYMNKEREAQVAEGKRRGADEKQESRRIDEEMEALRIRALEAQRQQDAARKETLRQQKQVLEQQMQDRDLARLAAYQEYLKEKQMVDAIVQKIQEEDHQEMVAKYAKQQRTQAYISQYLEERARFRHLEEERLKEEDRKILEFMKEQARRKEEGVRAARAKEAAQQKRLEEQSRQIAAERKQKEEMEQLIADYYTELAEKKSREKARAEFEKRVRARLMMIEANEYQKELKQAKKEAQAEEELEFRRRMLEKFAEDDRIDQMRQAERNRKRAEHNREVQRLLEERARQREDERQREVRARELDEEREAQKREIIRQERARLLREHASRLVGYLPKGVLTDEDMQTLGISSLDDLARC